MVECSDSNGDNDQNNKQIMEDEDAVIISEKDFTPTPSTSPLPIDESGAEVAASRSSSDNNSNSGSGTSNGQPGLLGRSSCDFNESS